MAKKHKNKKRFIPQGILTRETASNSPALGSMQQRTISFEAREINETERTVHVSFSSEAVVPRFWGTEVLCHDKDCVDLTRLTELGVSLFNHNRDKVIGVIKNPILNEVEKRCHCDIYFDDDEDSDKIFQKVKKGILRGVSVGYQVDRWEEVKTGEVSSNGRFKGPCFVATKWTPLEVSIVSVPADTDVGVNRTIEEVNKEVSVPLVLHGASGIGDEDIKKAIQCGIAKINIHTELCQAAMEAINEHKDEPFLAVERAVRQAVKERAMYKIKLFGDDGRADE